MRSLLLPIALLCSFALASSGAVAQLTNENLLAPLPKDYKIGFQKKTGGMLITEAVPAGETVENWTEC
jgi:hypothetical protein